MRLGNLFLQLPYCEKNVKGNRFVKALLLALIVFFSAPVIGQTYNQITLGSGVTTVAGVTVTVSPFGGASAAPFCGGNADPYFSPNGGGYTYTFSSPVASLRIPSQFGGAAPPRDFTYSINGSFYPITGANIIGPTTSGCHLSMATASGGLLIHPGTSQPSAVVEISGVINSVTVATNGAGSNWFGMFFALPALFDNGSSQNLTVCKNSSPTSINSLLAASSGTGTYTWSVVSGPSNGSLSGFPTSAPVGTNVTPTVTTTYQPTSGFSGTDAFTIQVSDGTFSQNTTINVTVNPMPITGTLTVCEGATTTLSSATTGGVWSSSSTGFATVGSATGVVTGVAAGTVTISYTHSCGGVTTAVVTVNATPSAITGTASVCIGSTTNLVAAMGGGVWTSSNTGVATIGSATGTVTGVSAGNSNITYAFPTGCFAATVVTVNSLPTVTSSSGNVVCAGTNSSVSATPSGGATINWYNAAVGSGFLGSGNVLAVTAPTVTTTYYAEAVDATTSCASSARATAVLTVNPNPATPAGTLNVCIGFTTTLSSATSGGSWSSGTPGVASVGGTGIVTGVSAGTADITYTLGTGCFSFVTVTVNANPAAIGGGPMDVCAGLTTTLTNGTGGGLWSSSHTSEATVVAGTGVVTGVSAGTPYITYTLPTGCYATQQITVNPNPAAISGTLSICIGATSTLTDPTAGGTWSSSAPGTASVVAGTGVVTGVAAGNATITYTLPTGCINTAVVTINPNPAAIGGTTNVCEGLTTTLTNGTGGGAWSSSDISKATIGSASGTVTGVAAGTLTITYMLPTGCFATTAFTVNTTPVAITGTAVVCVGSATTLSNGTGGGTWSSSNPAEGSIAATGIVTGISAGTPTITYTLATGCLNTVVVTVNPLPAAIGGTTNVCEGLTTTLTNATAGGSWTSSNPTLASVVSGTGDVTGNVAGTVNITYTLPTGCIATTPFTVNPTPPAISGSSTVCEGATITLTNASTGGTWSSSNGNATVVAGTGVVTGVTAGTVDITYTLPAGCIAVKALTVHPTPAAIAGASGVCVGLTTTLTDATAGGVWTSSNTSMATVGTGSGIVSGIAAGALTISYTLPAGCYAVQPFTVNPTPAAITGTTTVCVGSTVTLTDATGGGTWSSSNTGQATVGTSSGVVTGVSAGNPTITYTLPAGCTATTPITVNAVPDITNFTSPTALDPCLGNGIAVNVNSTTLGTASFTVTYNLSGANSSTANTATLTMGASTGTFNIPSSLLTNTGSTTVTITAITNSLGCTSYPASANTATFVVNPLPTAYTVLGTGSYCSGGAGIHVFLSNSVGGVSYQLYHNGSPTGSPVAGTFAAIDMGAQTAAGTYTIEATNTTTTCTNMMTGSAIITIDPLPTAYAVTGGGAYCAGSTGVTIGMANSQSGVSYQLWLSGSPSGSAISGTGGVISFAPSTSAGTYNVVATNTTTTCTNNMTGTATVTVNPLPSSITGTTDVCAGLTTTLASASSGGTWTSVNTAVATVGSSTGVVSGVSAGTSVISYTLPTGCATATTVTVNALPAAIVGSSTVCTGATTAFTDPTGGGTWTSSNVTEATAGTSSGIITGVAAGTPTITYTLPTGCIATKQITVIATPAAIGGTPSVCVGSTTLLTNTLSGVTWSSSNTAIATVGSSTGIVTGITAGTVTIICGNVGCTSSITFTVNPNPAAIAGTPNVCEGLTRTLTNSTTGGVWSSSNTTLATVGTGSGIVSGILAGSLTISYTLPTGCFSVIPFTVNPTPASITGAGAVCVGLTTTLSNATVGGSWSSSNTTTATIGAGTGVVTGVNAGPVTMTYTLPAGCFAVHTMTVNPNPAAIVGASSVCVGLTTTMTDATTGGSWSTSNVTVATISGGGVVSGVSAGTATITYTLPTGCIATKLITVNPNPAAIGGASTVCVASSTTLTNATSGGTWTSSNSLWATVVSGTGVVTGVGAGVPTITYTLPTGCIATFPITVNPLPASIAGPSTMCTGTTTTLSNATTGGTWSSSDLVVATVGSTTGLVNALTAGTVVMSYTLPTGCYTTLQMTINIQPAAITGASSVCNGFTTTLSNATSGGTWTSSNGTVASIGSGTGVVSGNATGTVMITYTMPGGCTSLWPFTVNPMPAAITGAGAVCVGSSITLANTSTGGTWSSSNSALGSVGSASGVVSGLSAGGITISYTLPGGCYVTHAVTVNPLPAAIMGLPVVCVNATTTLTNATSGGVWSSSDVSLATIGSSTGIVTGVSAGYPTFTYTIPTGCYVTIAATVNPLPPNQPVTGGGAYCAGGTGVTVGITGSNVGMNYQLMLGASPVGSALPGTGSAISYGLQTTAGTYTVVATNTVTACSVQMSGSALVVINPLPTAFALSSGGSYCAGGSGVTLSLSGSEAGVSYQLYIGTATSGAAVMGTGSSISFGSRTAAGIYTVVATNTLTYCTNTMTGTATIIINPLPTVYTMTGGGPYCTGGTGSVVGLSNSATGVNYTLLLGGVSTGITVAGTGSAISFGAQATAGTYTVSAQDALTSCVSVTTSSVVVTINSLPTVLTVSGGGAYCAGGTGVAVTLSGTTQSGVNYQLYYMGTALGSPVAGTGTGGISFGLQTGAGVGAYTVIATSASTTCTVNMSGSATVSINPLPTVYNVGGGGPICAGGPAVAITLSGSDVLTNYTTFLGTTPVALTVGTGSPLSGTSSTAGIYTVSAQNAFGCTTMMYGSAVITINPLPTAYNVTGTGSYCDGGTGVNVGLSNSQLGISYQLYLGASAIGSPVAGTGAAIGFGPQITPGIYTVVATNVATLCTNNMTGSATISVDPLPTVNIVTGGGSYCSGGTGVPVGLDGSVTGVSYQLFLDGVATGSPMAGTGSALSFGNRTVAGTYTIVATNTSTSCTSNMTGSATVVINPLPPVNNMTGGGSYCTGGAGVSIGLDGSVTGVDYQLFNGAIASGSPLTGTGFALDFGVRTTAGSYTVTATDAITGCMSTMTGSAIINVDPLPIVYNVTGGGGYCAGGTGMHVGLPNSQLGVSYQLMKDGLPLGAPMAGTGAVLDLGAQTLAGTYTIDAVNTVTGCTNSMAGSAGISINPLPFVYTVTGGGHYCIGGSGVDVSLTGSNIGITYQLFNGGSPVGAPVPGTGGAISFGLQTISGSYTAVATDDITTCTRNMFSSASVAIDPLPTVYTVTGGGSYCAGGAGVHIVLSNSDLGVDYQLMNGTLPSGSPIAGTGVALDFGLQTVAGVYTVVATNSVTACTGNMTGSATISINPLPASYSVTGGGSYCTGGTGVNIGLAGSSVGTSYQLYIDGVSTGLPEAGTGSLLDFGVYSMPGSYTVLATTTATGCTDNMMGSASITINALPTVYGVTGGGNACVGGAGLHVGLGSSDMGVTYQLYRGVTMIGGPVAGTGMALDFGIFTTAGVYTVEAVNATTGCMQSMGGSASITVFSLPTAFTVTGGGSYCAGGAGFPVGLSGSSFGVNYQLFNSGSPVGSPVAGTGSAISFGVIATGGIYTVEATNPSTGCMASMTGSATITVNPLPVVYTVTGGGNYCPGGVGVHVGVSWSNTGINYSLYRGTTLVATLPGTDSTVDFGLQTIAGTYTVVAMNATSSCTSNMTGSAVVVINALPTVYTVTGGGGYCAGGVGLHVTLSGSQTGVNYQLYRDGSSVGAPVAGTGFTLDLGVHNFAGTYTISATNATTTCTADMAGSVIIVINPLPALFTLTGGGSYCSGGAGLDIVLAGSTAGIQYQLFRGTTVVGTMTGTGASLNFGAQTVAGAYHVKATNIATGCTMTMIGTVAITINTLPVAYSVFGGGSYCSGGTGVNVSMTGSETGVAYQLYKDGTPSGSPVGGTGAALSFGLQTAAGVYTVIATNSTTGCTRNMFGSASVSINALPATFAVTGGGSYCSGGAGVLVGLSGSTAGISYQLRIGGFNEGTPVTGTGGVISFGLRATPGTYDVMATNPMTGCTELMSGSVNVVVNALPVTYVVTGGGNYCAGGTGVVIGLSNSTVGISYQLYHGSTLLGSAVSGSGSPITFGSHTMAGTYTVVATDVATGCTATMAGTASIGIIPTVVPSVTINTGVGDTICNGTSVTFTALTVNGGSSPSFQWTVNSVLVGIGSSYAYTPANSDVVSVVLTSSAACATPASANDEVTMTVRNNELPVVTIISAPGDTVCQGTMVTYVATSVYGGSSPTYNWYVNGAPVSFASSSFSYVPANNDVVFVNMNSNYPCLIAASAASNHIGMKVENTISPTVSVTASYGTQVGGVAYNDTFTAVVTNGGFNPVYQWSINGSAVIGANSPTFIQASLNNNDVVTCFVTNGNTCGTFSGSASVTVSGSSVGVQQVTSFTGDIRLVPNPNRGTFTIKGTIGNEAVEEVSIDITNMLGQVVYTTTASVKNGEIDTHVQLSNSLANGMYLVNIHAEGAGKVFHMVLEQ